MIYTDNHEDDMKECITNAIRAHAYFCKDISTSIDK